MAYQTPENPDARWRFVFEKLDENASEALASDLAGLLHPGDVLALDGDLGMGKSTLARALLRARGDDPCLEVPSPTFTLVQDYDLNGMPFSHFDLYRISDFDELYEIGLEDSWQEGCALIEWPDRALDLLPADTLWLHLKQKEGMEARQLTLSGPAHWKERLERTCQKRALLIASDWGGASRTAIKGDLSPRSYERVQQPDRGPSAVLMDSPAREPGPQLDDGRLYDLVAHRVTSLAPMISICEGLETLGLRVPDIYGYAIEEGLMLWEDFGTTSLAESSDKPVAKRYEATLSALAKLHSKSIPSVFDGAGGSHSLCSYDTEALAIELDIFIDWYWLYSQKVPCPGTIRDEFKRLWAPLLGQLQQSEQSLVLRDVQNPNCFWLDGEGDRGPIGFIDFQDCMIGPSAYDVSALCLDARVSIDSKLERRFRNHYLDQRGMDGAAQEMFTRAYVICAAQRISKNLGAFARASLNLGRKDYLDHIPRSLSYLKRVLAHEALEEIKDFYRAHTLID